MSAIGQSVPLPDAYERVTGRVSFPINLEVPGMLYGKIVRSTVPHGRLLGIETAEAEAVPGVVAVLTGADLREAAEQHGVRLTYGINVPDQPLIALDRVRFVGEPVAVVIAESQAIAEEAADLVWVDYEELPAVYSFDEILAPDAPLLHDDFPGNVTAHRALRTGDVERGFAESDYLFEEIYESPVAQAVPMETHVTIAETRLPERITIWTSSQAPFQVRAVVAQTFGLEPEQVRVLTGTLGGAYGAKTFVRIEPLTSLASWKAGRPVRIVLDRAEEFITVTKHAARIWIKTGVKADGTLHARQIKVWWNGGAYADATPFLIGAGMVRVIGPYRIPHVAVDSYGLYSNLPPASAFRGAMQSQATWAYESQMDTIAARLGLDPLEIRRRNVLRDGDRFATGETMHDVHFAELLEACAEAVEWERPSEPPVEPHLKRGKGLAVMMKSTITPGRSRAAVTAAVDGRCELLSSTVEMGQGSSAALRQLVADRLGLPLDAVGIVAPDTDQTPFDQTTSASRSSFFMGNAVVAAADDLKARACALAAELLGLPANRLRFAEGAIHLDGPEPLRLSLAELLRRAEIAELRGEGEYFADGGLDEQGHGLASVHWHQGAGACEVEVDTETGQLRILRYHGTSWAGRIINPTLVKLQNDGNIIFGLGPTLFEELVFDRGQAINANLSDYMIPSFLDLPEQLTTASLEAPDGQGDVHGIAEMTLPSVAPAIANAIYDATGVRIRTLPLTPERVLDALLAGREEPA